MFIFIFFLNHISSKASAALILFVGSTLSNLVTKFFASLEILFHILSENKKSIDYYGEHNCYVRLFKPHGSINWISNDNGEILINDFNYLSTHSDDIEIIAPGSSKYEAGMINNTFRIMREYFNELISDMNKPYSLLIYGYGFNDTHFNTVLFQNKQKNVLILSKDIKEDVLEKARNNPMVTAFFQNDSRDFMIYKGEQIEIDQSLWNIDIFADIFLGD